MEGLGDCGALLELYCFTLNPQVQPPTWETGGGTACGDVETFSPLDHDRDPGHPQMKDPVVGLWFCICRVTAEG
ncbi:hypothetical protein AAFF_G00224990 [Aldrovandia affinis]|uniref:Uncharacterized protein n=1 Tax=Aldrovandia affinis TaxID=143900 RepID=A0AAD7X1G6_9TELE|nr:hypothetical protein AAFF_G00224990 [Aldrovandia affinis]